MIIIKADPKRPGKKPVNMALKILRAGGTIAFPTDTVYGIAAMPFKRNAIYKLYRIKKRAKDKPIAILVSSKKEVVKFTAGMPNKVKHLISKYWPGPLTLIFRKRKSVPDYLTSGLPTIGIRMPKNDIALKVIRAAGGALAVTSANISGNKPAISADQIRRLKGIDLILDGGKCRIGVPSMVIAIDNGKLRVLRKGAGIKL